MNLKPYIIIAALSILATAITFRACRVEPPQPAEDPRDSILDSLILRSYEQDQELQRNSIAYDSAIEVIQSESFVKVVERFTTIYGKTDTILEPTYLVDSTALAECNKQEARLDSNRLAIAILEDKLIGTEVAFFTALDQRNEHREELGLWHKWDGTPKLRLIKRCRLKRKINNF